MTLTREDPALAEPLRERAQLLEYFRRGEKPRESWRVGTEYEKLGILLDTLEPVPYDGARGIGALLEGLRRDHGFEPLLDGDRLVGLAYGEATISLEPGGQLELSGAPLRTLHETSGELREHLAQLARTSERFGIAWLALGLQPFVELERAPRMPRERYSIMREHLGKRDSLGLHMMHMTAGVQANLDFGSAADLARKLRVSLAASPVTTALFANSALAGGKPAGFESRRAHIWRHTDPDRCGLLPFVFDPGWDEASAYARYTEWALGVPMLFILREGHHLPARGITFREFMRSGLGGHAPTLADWNLHLTTLFPEVRVKRVLEVRSADAVPADLCVALPAFWKGLLYDETALGEAERRLARWTHPEVDALQRDAASRGLAASAPDGPVASVARDLVSIARDGLRRIGEKDASGRDESGFVDPLLERIERGASPARELLGRWQSWAGHRERLVEYARY
jgi:glutamate--cysteine ligase